MVDNEASRVQGFDDCQNACPPKVDGIRVVVAIGRLHFLDCSLAGVPRLHGQLIEVTQTRVFVYLLQREVSDVFSGEF